MSRSWLAEAKSVHDLGDDFYVPRSKAAYSWEREVAKEEKSLARRRGPVPVAEKWLPFFGSQMHDSWVVGVERTAKEVRVKLDSINADIFAIDLADILEVARVRRQWPVDFLFHDIHYMRCARYAPDASLKFYDSRLLRSAEPQRGPQFITDWFIQEHDRLQWIADIYVSEWPRRPNLSSSAFLMIDCERVSVVDRRLRALEEVFGPAVRPLWEDAIGGVDVGDEPYGCWSASTMESFLLRRLSHHGLMRSDFLV